MKLTLYSKLVKFPLYLSGMSQRKVMVLSVTFSVLTLTTALEGPHRVIAGTDSETLLSPAKQIIH